jgi:ankyrin repeat protein
LYDTWRQAQNNADLVVAVKSGDYSVVNALLGAGADPNASEITDTRPFWQKIRDLIGHVAPPENGAPAVEIASDAEDWVVPWKDGSLILLALLKHGADPNVRGFDGLTPLLWACKLDDRPLERMALAKGANANVQNGEGETPLMKGATSGDTELVRTLLEHGARLNVKDNNDDTALVYALHYPPDSAVVEILLKHGAAANVIDGWGDTPLKLARRYHRPDLVTLLRQYGAKK